MGSAVAGALVGVEGAGALIVAVGVTAGVVADGLAVVVGVGLPPVGAAVVAGAAVPSVGPGAGGPKQPVRNIKAQSPMTLKADCLDPVTMPPSGAGARA